jgi:hypothetical protein
MAAEAAARAELQSLQQQLERHKEEARAQAEAFKAAKMQLLALQVKTAQNRECLLRSCLMLNVVTAGAEGLLVSRLCRMQKKLGDASKRLRHLELSLYTIAWYRARC